MTIFYASLMSQVTAQRSEALMLIHKGSLPFCMFLLADFKSKYYSCCLVMYDSNADHFGGRERIHFGDAAA